MSIQLGEKPSRKRSTLPWLKSGLIACAVTCSLYTAYQQSSFPSSTSLEGFESQICPTGLTLRPTEFYKNNSSVEHIAYDPKYRLESAHKLSGAIQIPTVVHDNMPSPDDDPEAWSEFSKFHSYLAEQFPLVHEHLTLEKVNSYGLVYTWGGNNETLKPLLLTAHQDVVPVEESTKGDWLYGPFDGHFDGTNIWGRGSSDIKTMVIADLQAVEKLLGEGYVPERTIIMAFGFDEEVGGYMGAGHIGPFLQERYGDNSFYALLDEGGTAISTIGGTVFAQPSVGEKGSLSLRATLTTPGGHSSVPPDHTNIGLISRLVAYIEDHPFEPIMGVENPTLNFLQCVAKHSDEYSPELKKNVFASAFDKVANSKVLEYLDQFKAYKFLVRTTQAVDIIHGGVKVNALPEFVSFDINHRISVESSVNATIEKILGDISFVAEEYGLGAYFDSRELVSKTDNGYFNVTVLTHLEPAHSTPIKGNSWDVFSGSIKHIIEDYIYPNLTRPAIVSGSLNTGNTDTHHYWNLTDNIYRFRLSTMHGILEGHTHSVNEHTTIDNHLYLVAFMYEYIRNVNEFATD